MEIGTVKKQVIRLCITEEPVTNIDSQEECKIKLIPQ